MEYYAAKARHGFAKDELVCWDSPSGQLLIAIDGDDRPRLEEKLARFIALPDSFPLTDRKDRKTTIGALRAKMLEQQVEGRLGIGLPGIYPERDPDHGLIPPGIIESALIWINHFAKSQGLAEASKTQLLGIKPHNCVNSWQEVSYQVQSGDSWHTYVVTLSKSTDWRAEMIMMDGQEYSVVSYTTGRVFRKK